MIGFLRRHWFAVIFLPATFATVVMEFWAAFDGREDTVPWTGYLIQLPWWALMPAASGFAGWLVWHMWDAKRRKERQQRR